MPSLSSAQQRKVRDDIRAGMRHADVMRKHGISKSQVAYYASLVAGEAKQLADVEALDKAQESFKPEEETVLAVPEPPVRPEPQKLEAEQYQCAVCQFIFEKRTKFCGSCGVQFQ